MEVVEFEHVRSGFLVLVGEPNPFLGSHDGRKTDFVQFSIHAPIVELGVIPDHHSLIQVSRGAHTARRLVGTVVVEGNGLGLTVNDKSNVLPFGCFPTVYHVELVVGVILSPTPVHSFVVVVTHHQFETDFLVPPALGTEYTVIIDVIGVARGNGRSLEFHPHRSREARAKSKIRRGRNFDTVGSTRRKVLSSTKHSGRAGGDFGLLSVVSIRGGIQNRRSLLVIHVPTGRITRPNLPVVHVTGKFGHRILVTPPHLDGGVSFGRRQNLGYLHPNVRIGTRIPAIELVGKKGTARGIGEADIAATDRGDLRIFETVGLGFVHGQVGRETIKSVGYLELDLVDSEVGIASVCRTDDHFVVAVGTGRIDGERALLPIRPAGLGSNRVNRRPT